MLKVVWQSSVSKDDTVMLWAAVCMCFFVLFFLRSGEVVAPAEADNDPAVHLSYVMLGLMMWAHHTIWRCGLKHPRGCLSFTACSLIMFPCRRLKVAMKATVTHFPQLYAHFTNLERKGFPYKVTDLPVFKAIL